MLIYVLVKHVHWSLWQEMLKLVFCCYFEPILWTYKLFKNWFLIYYKVNT